ncbi:adrenomedullin a [Cynoglossus semilaevis]|uniref:Adrenomedullin a n=1 Tax=Cynoglossus semilaevis TaxID=244447 RepID=A0A3P8WYC3_CYNSE|nr:ADM [Cynoglossus semilaevis]
MKLILHSFLYCCLLATVAHCVELEVNPQVKKRLSLWLEHRLRRNLDSVSVEKTADSENFVRAEEVRDNLLPHSRTGISVRTKRSKNPVSPPRRQGCSLGTCTVHDLAHRLHQLNNKLKIGNAPPDMLSPKGYGRRRRSVPEQRPSRSQEQDRPEWRITDSQVHKLMALLKRT